MYKDGYSDIERPRPITIVKWLRDFAASVDPVDTPGTSSSVSEDDVRSLRVIAKHVDELEQYCRDQARVLRESMLYISNLKF